MHQSKYFVFPLPIFNVPKKTIVKTFIFTIIFCNHALFCIDVGAMVVASFLSIPLLLKEKIEDIIGPQVSLGCQFMKNTRSYSNKDAQLGLFY